jgi:hypothetical protein
MLLYELAVKVAGAKLKLKWFNSFLKLLPVSYLLDSVYPSPVVS